MGPRIAFTDVAYRDPLAVAACVVAEGWSAPAPIAEHVVAVPLAGAYEPGRFYLRELPPLLAVLARVESPDVIVVDGYVWLGPAQPGLGARLYDALGLPVVGVAKTAWRGSPSGGDDPRRSVPVLRGASAKPLLVTAAGMDVAEAAAHVAAMHGPHRIPTLLRAVDRLGRTAETPQPVASPRVVADDER